MRRYAITPTLHQADAETLLRPPGDAEGNWIGAPCVHRHDGDRLLAIRERVPDDRGHEARIYHHTTDGDLRERVTLTASDLGVVSIERPALVTDPATGDLVLYVPVDHGSNDWTIQKLAPVADPADLDPATAHDVLRPKPGTADAVTVKDPYVVTVGGRYYMFYAGHDGVSEQAHLATSVDGDTWERAPHNPVIGRQHWHDHHTRVSCVAPAPDAPVWHVFYEASSTTDYGKTWNLRTALATTTDLDTVTDTSPDGPRYAATPAGRETGVDGFETLRYLDVIDAPDGDRAYYEVARPDGTFELRTAPITL